MAIPEQIDASCLSDYLEIMTKAVFQAGVSWAMVDNKWTAFKTVFANFDPVKVAKFSEKDVERLASDASIIRSKQKIEATIMNAKTILALDKEYGGFGNYLHSQPDYKSMAKDLKKRFKFMGELNAYYFLFRLKETVPDFEEWVITIEGEHPRMREMVNLAKQKATISKIK